MSDASEPEPGPDRVMLRDPVVLLRPWRDTDAEWYAAAVQDPEIQRFTSEPASLTADEVRRVFAQGEGDPVVTGFAVCDAGSGELLGSVGVKVDGSVAEVGYWVAATARGRGVASRAVRLVSEWARHRFDLTELRLWTHAGNTTSGRVAERAGYRRAPEHDRRRVVKGEPWDTLAYRRTLD